MPTNTKQDESTRPQIAPRTKIRSSSIPRPLSALERNISGLSSVQKSSAAKSNKDNTFNERYSNKLYNRTPSPKVKTQARTMKGCPPSRHKLSIAEEEQRKPASRVCERVQPPSPAPRLMIMKKHCSNDTSKRQLLDVEYDQAEEIEKEVDLKPRPKTTHYLRTESRLEQRVLGTVKNVLSQALMHQGKIDETNIENIISSMKNRLNLCDEDLKEIDLCKKPSRITLNEVDLLAKHSSVKMNKSVAGIIRRDNSGVIPERKQHRKVYDELYSPSKQSTNQRGSQGDDSPMSSMDLPDLFLSSSSQETYKKPSLKSNVEQSSSNQSQQVVTPKRGLSRQFEVGDFQTKGSTFWNSFEDAKLQQFVESLVHSMKNQNTSDNSVKEVESKLKSKVSLCTSICVCKECISKKSEPMSVIKQKPSRTEERLVVAKESKPLKIAVQKPKPSKTAIPQESRIFKSTVQILKNREESKHSILQGVQMRSQFLKPPSNHNMSLPFKKINNNHMNLKQESSLNVSLNKCPTFTEMVRDNNTEDGDDRYLRVRINRQSSAKLR